jgi:hypothetical protein
MVAMPQLMASHPWSNSRPRGDEAPIFRACFPSELSKTLAIKSKPYSINEHTYCLHQRDKPDCPDVEVQGVRVEDESNDMWHSNDDKAYKGDLFEDVLTRLGLSL